MYIETPKYTQRFCILTRLSQERKKSILNILNLVMTCAGKEENEDKPWIVDV